MQICIRIEGRKELFLSANSRIKLQNKNKTLILEICWSTLPWKKTFKKKWPWHPLLHVHFLWKHGQSGMSHMWCLMGMGLYWYWGEVALSRVEAGWGELNGYNTQVCTKY